MTSRLSKCCDIINWAIINKKSLNKAQEHFKVHSSYVRDSRARCKSHSGYDEFISAYNSFLHSEPTASDSLKFREKKFTESGDTASYEYRGDKMLKSLEDAVKFFKIDTRIWEVERWVCNSYPVSARRREQDLTWEKNAEGNQVMEGYSKRHDEWTTTVNYQIKVWLKKKIDFETAISLEDFYINLLKKHRPAVYTGIKHQKNKSNNLLEISIYDLHVGKLCWSEEVENNYDTKIASTRFNYALRDLLKKAESSQYEKILFIVGNDFFNSDTHTNTTTAGTRQDEDSRWQKTFRTGSKLLIEGIDLMRSYAPVDVLVIPGNHDHTKSFFLGETLYAWYRNDKLVNVNNSANPRKYYEYGNVLLGFTHGNNEKPEKLRSLMAWEAKDQWSRTVYREFHLGHQHRKLMHEELGLVIRSMSSLAGTDAWHHQSGFIGPTRAAEAFLWNKESGLSASFNSNIRIGDDAI